MPKSAKCASRRDRTPKRPAKTLNIRHGLILLCLFAFSLAGCSGKTVPVMVTPLIPSALVAPLQVPVWQGKTNQDLLEYAQDLEETLDRADADRSTLRALLKEDNALGKTK